MELKEHEGNVFKTWKDTKDKKHLHEEVGERIEDNKGLLDKHHKRL